MNRSADRRRRWTGRQLLVVAVPVLLLLAFSAMIASTAVEVHRTGWSGMFIMPGGGDPEENAPPEWMRGWWMWRMGPGKVFMVAPASPAARAGIERGDELVSVNGVPITDPEALRRTYAGLRTGDRVVYEMRRGAHDVWRFEVRRASPLHHGPTLSGLLTGLLVILVYLGISILMGWSRARSRAAPVFYLLCLVTSVSLFAYTWFSFSMNKESLIAPEDFFTPTRGVVWILLVASAVAGSTLILHLALVFPRRRPVVVRHRTLVPWVHLTPWLLICLPLAAIAGLATDRPGWPLVLRVAIAAAVLLAALLWLRRRWPPGDDDAGFRRFLLAHPYATFAALVAAAGLAAPLADALPRPLELAVLAGFFVLSLLGATLGVPLVYAVLTLLSLVRSYGESGVEEKRQIRWPLWGLTMTLVGGLVYSLVTGLAPQLVPDLLDSQGYYVCSNALFSLIYLPLPVAFAFAIAKYRLMEVDLLLRKTAVYGATTAVLLAGSLLVAGGLSLALLSWTRVDSPVVAVAATLALVALFVPVRNRMQTLVDRRFGRGAGDRREALETIRRRVLAAADLNALLEPMVETVQQTLESRTAVLLVRPPEGSALVARAKVGLPDEVVGALTVDAAAFGDAGRLVERDDLSVGDEVRSRLKRLRLQLLAPARRQGQVVGAVAVGRTLEGGDPDADEREFLTAVADQLALAVGTLGPRREARELDQARQIQESLLPGRLPEVPGVEVAGLWRPAREVAGDYYDVLDFGDGRAGLCIADVVGKGMPAAMTMSGLQAAVRAVAAADVPPDRVCEQVRRVVTSGLTGGKFVTFFYALLDAPAHRLTYANAGHAPPFLVRAGGGVETLETGGGALTRLLAGTPFRRGEIDLGPGDKLLLYTDGVTEARGRDGSLFGEQRLVDVVRSTDGDAAALRAAVADAVGSFSAGEAQDDLTLLVLHVPGGTDPS